MKSYITLEQSKIFVEFLPLESADSFYATDDNIIITEPYITYLNGEKNIPAYKGTVPCWSLAALLNVLPDEVEDNHYLTLDKEGKEYCCSYEDCNGNSFRHCFSDNPVDACVDMILKLHELKML